VPTPTPAPAPTPTPAPTARPAPTPAPFSAQLVTAPPERAFLGADFADPVRFQVAGTGIRNVELVSARDPSVVYGRFNVSSDGSSAVLDWHFYDYNYGSYLLRVVAWDVLPGGVGREIEVMAPRSYTVHLPRACQGEGTCGGEAP
jgi:hypothetical protein